MDKYFAQKDSIEVVDHLMNFNTQWNNLTTPYQTGIGSVWARNINYYYNNVLYGDSKTGLSFGGNQGELVSMVVPQARSLTTQSLSLTTKQKLYFDPQALSTDAATLADTRVARALCDRTLDEQRIDQKGYRLGELTHLMGSAYYRVAWDMNRGKMVGFNQANQKTVYTGGNRVSVHTCYDLAFDHTIEDFYEQEWIRIRTLRNRWDLIAEHPEMTDYIKRLPKAFQEGEMVFYWQMNISDDMVWVYEFFHKSTSALPLGRYMVFCDNKTILFDEDNPYKNDMGAYIPVVELKPEPIAGTGFGYPMFSNLLPMQEMLDHNMSAIATNHNAFAVKSILNPSGNDINVKHIQNLKFINYKPMNVQGGGKPEVLDLNSKNTELYNFNGNLVQHMQQIAAINSAIRGEPGAGITSGTAIATLSANAIEFAQNFSKGYVFAHELLMYYSVLNYRNFVTYPELVSITGPNDSNLAKEFIGDDLKNIRRVKCSISNPLMATAAGKLEIANNLLQQGQADGRKYLMILEGAPIETIFERELDEATLIQEENDELRKPGGQDVLVFREDDHPLHIQEHASLLNNMAIRNNGAVSMKIRKHILEHYDEAQQMDPNMYQMIKTGQLPPQMAQQIAQRQAMQQQMQMQQQMGPPPGPPGPNDPSFGPNGPPSGPPPGMPVKPNAIPPPPGQEPQAGPAKPQHPMPGIQNASLGGLAPTGV